MNSHDPIRARRQRVGRLAAAARGIGWALFGLATVVFIAGLAVGLTGAITVIVIGSLVVGSVFLAPAIIVGYGVKAAEREDPRRS